MNNEKIKISKPIINSKSIDDYDSEYESRQRKRIEKYSRKGKNKRRWLESE
jgi:hypothetical protein